MARPDRLPDVGDRLPAVVLDTVAHGRGVFPCLSGGPLLPHARPRGLVLVYRAHW